MCVSARIYSGFFYRSNNHALHLNKGVENFAQTPINLFPSFCQIILFRLLSCILYFGINFSLN